MGMDMVRLVVEYEESTRVRPKWVGGGGGGVVRWVQKWRLLTRRNWDGEETDGPHYENEGEREKERESKGDDIKLTGSFWKG